jgi:hypothetical protein
MMTHLDHHRAKLCGVDVLAALAAQYVSEIYPAGDLFATDCTRTAVAIFLFFTGKVDLIRVCEQTDVIGAPCPMDSSGPMIVYMNLTRQKGDRFETTTGHRLVIVLAKGRARVMHAFKDKFTLEDHMRRTGSMSLPEFEAWWAKLQEALVAVDGTRVQLFDDLLGPVGFADAVGASWMCTAAVDLGV